MSGIQQMLLGKSQVAVVTDPYFYDVTLLLPGTGTNGAQNNTFLDSSTNNFTITRNGNTTQGTFSPFSQTGWGVSLSYKDGDYLRVANAAALDMGAGDFTVECWVNPSTLNTASVSYVVAKSESSTFYAPFGISINGSSRAPLFAVSTNGTSYAALLTGAVIDYGKWTHLALVRSGNSIQGFVNGVGTSITTISGALVSTSYGVTVGTSNSTGTDNKFGGTISNLRIVKGTAIYTSNFTPSTTPLTAVPGTSLLTCQSNRFVDNSSNAFAITVNGDTNVQAFSPFNPTAAWSAATNGGSGYFDGSGDYLTVGSTNAILPTGTQDYSVEAWVYWGTQVTTYPQIVSNPTSNGFQIYYDTGSGYLAVGKYGVGSVITYTIAQTALANTWTHILATRSGNTHRLFVNGVLRANGSDSVSFASLTTQSIGSGGAANYIVGYISGLRTVLGSIPTSYQTSSTTNGTSIFTPPTAPPTTTSEGATSNDVEFLTNFTNAGITDATAKNDLETVGNAQISSTTAKWGSTSIKFDGSGDWLLGYQNVLYDMGNGDFTVEFWVNTTTTSSGACIVGATTGGGGTNTQWGIFQGYASSTSVDVYLSNGSSYFANTGGGIITDGNWHHVAFTRYGTSGKLFVDGVQVGSTLSLSTTSLAPTNKPIYVGAQGGSYNFNGYLQDLRITKGYARYTANFTPPTAAFPLL